MRKTGSLIMFLSALCMAASAQDIQSIVGTYVVSEVCTLEEDTTYKEEADYTITLEAGEDTDHVIRFMIPAHGIPDFVKAESNNGGAFSFSQKFRLGDGRDDEPYYLHIHGDGRERKDSLTMKYVLAATGAYGTLQCAVKGVRQMNVWAAPDIITWKGEARWMVWSLYREYSAVNGQREYRTDQYLFGKDTTIRNNAYWEVSWRENSDAKNEVSANYALREDSVRVYVYDYASQKEYILFDFSLKEDDVLTMDWIEETDARKNPVFRVLAVGDTILPIAVWQERLHYLKVYDTVHHITDMWMSKIGSVSHGIAWHRDFDASLDTLETVLCVNGGDTYKNPEYPSCYISQVEPEYVSCTKKLIITWAPSLSFPELDCCYKALAIRWGDLTPILSFNSTWAYDELPLQVNGVDYMEGDSVEVEGYVLIRRNIQGWLYSELEIENIRKINATSVEKQQKSELRIHPNPANETITLSAAGCKFQRVEILDANGRVLYASTCNDTDSFCYNVSWLPAGLYFARVTTPCGVLTEKFSVK